eukprot:evm.model.scf_814.5 EVM.evm.TU.scf_814.5   scf_814:19861-20879(-)
MAEAAKDAAAKEAADVAKEDSTAKEGKDAPTIDINEIRVTAQGKMRNYVTYAASLFTDKNQTTVVLKGMGRVINKTVSLAEILKRRVKGLYQLTEIGSVEVTDTTPAQEEDGEPTETTRLLSVISIVLTTTPPDDTSKYQTPLPDTEVEPLKKSQVRSAARAGPSPAPATPPRSLHTRASALAQAGEVHLACITPRGGCHHPGRDLTLS